MLHITKHVVIRSSNVNRSLWSSFYVYRTLCLYCAPVSLARYENTPPVWRGFILIVIVRTWIVLVIINISLWSSFYVYRTLSLYCAPVSLARYENTPPVWRGFISLVIVQTWIVLVIINIVNITVSSKILSGKPIS